MPRIATPVSSAMRSPMRSPLRAITERRGNSLEAAIRSLFANGEQGGWWDPSDFSTMFQDSAGTTPVTAVGQPVGMPRDKSGRGNHLVQGTTSSRATLDRDANGYLRWLLDGTDDSWATAGNVDFSATGKVTVIAGVTKLSDAATGALVELSATSSANNGTFAVFAPYVAGGSTTTYAARSRGTLDALAVSPNGYVSPNTAMLTFIGDITGDTSVLRVNGVQAATQPTDQGTGSYGSYPLYVGRRGGTTLPLVGALYGLIIVGRLLTPTELALAERYMASKMGITL